MSGDVQPRKRKDKRRKKAAAEYTIQRIRSASLEEEDAGTPPPTLVHSSEHENVTIHVHKDGGTGGHWCARIIFFALLTILVSLIGIIILEHRGSTDVDTPVAQSRWATIFDGWVDDTSPTHDESPEGHDDEHEEHSEEADDHGDEQEEDEEDEEEGHDEEEENGSEEVALKDSKEDEDDNEGIGSQEEEDEDEAEEHDGGEVSDEDQLDEEASKENDDDDQDNKADLNLHESDDEGFVQSDEENEDTGALEEVDNTSGEENDGADQDDQDVIHESDNELDVSIEGVKASGEEQPEDDVSEEFLGIPGVNEIDDNSAEPLEEVEDEEPEEVINEAEIEPEPEEIEEESTGVAVKFGVGVALVVAAHFVLVRRWNNAENESGVPDLSRRNTIVPPPQGIEQIASTIDVGGHGEKFEIQKVSQTYEDLKSKYKSLEAEGDTENVFAKTAGLRVEKMSAKDIWAERSPAREELKSLPKDTAKETSEEEEEELETSEGERISGTDEDEDEEEEEDEVDDIDDSDLVAKLEAKYGKLPTPPESEVEDEEEEEEEDEEEEEEAEGEEGLEEDEEDDDIQGWKRVKAPKESQSESEEEPKPVSKPVQKGKQGGGAKDIEIISISNPEDVIIKEDVHSEITKEHDD